MVIVDISTHDTNAPSLPLPTRPRERPAHLQVRGAGHRAAEGAQLSRQPDQVELRDDGFPPLLAHRAR